MSKNGLQKLEDAIVAQTLHILIMCIGVLTGLGTLFLSTIYLPFDRNLTLYIFIIPLLVSSYIVLLNSFMAFNYLKKLEREDIREKIDKLDSHIQEDVRNG